MVTHLACSSEYVWSLSVCCGELHFYGDNICEWILLSVTLMTAFLHSFCVPVINMSLVRFQLGAFVTRPSLSPTIFPVFLRYPISDTGIRLKVERIWRQNGKNHVFGPALQWHKFSLAERSCWKCCTPWHWETSGSVNKSNPSMQAEKPSHLFSQNSAISVGNRLRWHRALIPEEFC